MDYNKAFSELSPQEFAVIYWKSQGLTHVQVGDVLGWGMDSVQKYVSKAHKKLGLGELLQKRRETILESEVYPALREWIKHHADVLNNLRPPEEPQIPAEVETVDGEPVEDTQPQKAEKKEPPVIVIPDQQRISGNARRPVATCAMVTVLFVVVGAVGFWFGTRFLNSVQETPVSTDVQALPPQASSTDANDEIVPTNTSIIPLSDTPEPTLAPEPTLTYTPEIPPTAVPFPVREDFSKKYSDLWWVSGNPFVSENIQFGNFSGVLTTYENETATLMIGNTAWSDYVVSLSTHMPLITNHMLIGVRAKDLNNMIALDCRYDRLCQWVIVYQGVWETLPTNKVMYITLLTITAEGDTFTAVGRHPGNASVDTLSFVLPPKYDGMFQGGGVVLQITSAMEIDYVDINPLP